MYAIVICHVVLPVTPTCSKLVASLATSYVLCFTCHCRSYTPNWCRSVLRREINCSWGDYSRNYTRALYRQKRRLPQLWSLNTRNILSNFPGSLFHHLPITQISGPASIWLVLETSLSDACACMHWHSHRRSSGLVSAWILETCKGAREYAAMIILRTCSYVYTCTFGDTINFVDDSLPASFTGGGKGGAMGLQP